MEANQKPAGGGGGGDSLKEAGLRALLQRTGYQLRQEKGQRRYGAPPPGWEGPPPERGSEIFVGKLPRDLFEDELVPLCEKFGRIYEVRMMMDFNGNNRGYAFVTYGNKTEAKNAVKQLNNYEIRPGRLVGVVSSVDNCRLFVGGVPRWKRREEVLAEIQKVTDGAVDAIVYPAAGDKTKNRGFAFVEFQSHRHAAMARRKLLPGRIQLWGHSVAVDWAEPEVEVDEETMATVKILYVRNLMLATSEETLMQEFSALKPGSVERVKKIRDYAFVHFSQRDDAITAMNALNGKVLDGSRIEVTLAKPVDKESYVRYTRGTGGRGAGPLEYPAYSLGQVFEASSAYLGAPVFYAAPPPYVATPLSASFQRYPLAKVGGRGAFCAPSVRGAAGLRGLGGRGYLAYSPTGGGASGRVGGASPRGGKAELSGKEEKLYELLPGMELTPLAVSIKGLKPATQVLEELCAKNSWGVPLYQLHSAVGPDQRQLFLYKVTVPALASQHPNTHPFTPGKLSAALDEAKNHAAEHTLHVLGLQAEANASVAAYAGFGSPSKSLNQDLNLAYEAFPPFTVAPPPDAYPGF